MRKLWRWRTKMKRGEGEKGGGRGGGWGRRGWGRGGEGRGWGGYGDGGRRWRGVRERRGEGEGGWGRGGGEGRGWGGYGDGGWRGVRERGGGSEGEGEGVFCEGYYGDGRWREVREKRWFVKDMEHFVGDVLLGRWSRGERTHFVGGNSLVKLLFLTEMQRRHFITHVPCSHFNIINAFFNQIYLLFLGLTQSIVFVYWFMFYQNNSEFDISPFFWQ